ncbi:hypothetical protein BH10PLA2_BH10PLA2_29810 [soil metagenome]
MISQLLILLLAPPLIGAEHFEPADLQNAIAVLRKVTPDNQAGAAEAWRQLAGAKVEQLPELLAGMDGSSAVARNWLRSSIDQVLESAKKENKPLPYGELEAFVRERKHDPQARRFAYELIVEKDKKAADKFLPTMLDDPSPELRRDAVARLLDEGNKVLQSDKKQDALPTFQKALASARDIAQINKAARALRDLGQKVDLPTHLGLVADWKLIGPFANPDDKGIDIVYPPEKAIELTASYDGLKDKVKWKNFISAQEMGMIDLDANILKNADGVGYAFTEFTSDRAQDVDIRIACYTPFKLWLNDALTLVRSDAYTGSALDHYQVRVHLKPGVNKLLMKVSRAQAPPQVPNLWRFQLRVCDADGAAIRSTTRPATPAPEKKS